MQRLVQLVNEKNSLVRRQMQLNILEQVTISKDQSALLIIKASNEAASFL